MKDDGTIEITEEELDKELQPTARADRKTVTSYWELKSTGHSEQFIAHFNILTPQQVKVTTRIRGKVNVSLHFFNITQNHAGPTLTQKGGTAGLDPGYWKLYFTGSIGGGAASIYATVSYT